MKRPFAAVPLALALALLPASVGAQGSCAAPSPDDPARALSRTDHAATGNRLVRGCGPLSGEIVDLELGGSPTWVLADPSDRGRSWFVTLEDGTVIHVVAAPGSAPRVSVSEWPALEPGEPPMALATGADDVAFGSALGAAGWFEDPLPDSRTTELSSRALVALAGPTERYDHGVLGDGLEASAIEVRDETGSIARIEVEGDEVIEGTSAMVVELVSDDPRPELLVTISDAEAGARLRAYDLDGAIVAESAPIGQGYRWLHQIATGALGPDGETEIIAVRTPHIGGVVEAYRLADDRLERVASIDGYSSHVLGSSNLDMALLADIDSDGRLDIVVPDQGMTELGVLARTAAGFELVDKLPLDGVLATNVAAADADGKLVLAVGTADGRVRIFR